jgi:hypothetical protein
MVTTHDATPGFAGHLWTWVQAIALVYVIGFAMVLLAAAISLSVGGAMVVLSWAAALLRGTT